MSYLRFLLKYILIIILFFSSIGGIVYAFDPYSVYRFPDFYDKQYSTNARFQMPGFIRHSKYDTVIVGTSMGRNFVESYVDEKLNAKSLNATIPASTAHEQYLSASLALNTHEVKRVIWELNYYSFEGGNEFVLNAPNKFPFYLYDDNKLNDVKYLLSSYSLSFLADNLKNNLEKDRSFRDREMLFKFGFENNPANKESVPDDLKAIKTTKELEPEFHSSVLLDSFKHNVINLIEEHPETTFTFFYAPYPIVDHMRYYNENNERIKERLMFKEKAFDLLMNYENVEVYDFQDMSEITFDMENYMTDHVHYFPSINNFMIDYINNNPPISSKKEMMNKINFLNDQIQTFNYLDLN